jgi:hypothetical protein
VASGDASVTVAIPEFWQQFPKALTIDSNRLRIGLFPREFNDLFELQGGERKTHTIWLRFAESESDSGVANCRALEWVHSPMPVHAVADWCDTTGALPALAIPSAESNESLQKILDDATSGPDSISVQREKVDEYGWRNYGEVVADHERLHYRGAQPLVSHYNNQFDMLYGFLIHGLRTADTNWWQWGDALARHVVDIDIYHTGEDRAAYNGGLFWFTDHYMHAHTSTHRTYSKFNRSTWKQSYGGGPGPEHNFTSGLLLHYCLTGDEISRDAVVTLAEWVIGMDDGRRTLLGLLDNESTGLATNGQVLGRAAGNSINALMDAWTLTADKKYLEFLEVLIRRCIHPNDDVGARQLLDVEKSWSYTVFLRSLSKYLDLKVEAEQIDDMYGYAQASLTHYARWMLENERPYFDQLEKLEFPTEAWPAQELRKANVLRLAARHVDEPLRTLLLDRGDTLGDRAWKDLMGFETRASARAVAIVMTEGLLDCTLRSRTFAAARRFVASGDFGQPSKYISQRERVKSAAQHPAGIARIIARLANPISWARKLRGSCGPSVESG